MEFEHLEVLVACVGVGAGSSSSSSSTSGGRALAARSRSAALLSRRRALALPSEGELVGAIVRDFGASVDVVDDVGLAEIRTYRTQRGILRKHTNGVREAARRWCVLFLPLCRGGAPQPGDTGGHSSSGQTGGRC